MLDKLSDSLKEAVRKIAMANKIDKHTVDEIVRDIQRALIQADVKISLVKELSERIRERSLKEKVVLNPREHVIKVVYEELMNILGKAIDNDGRLAWYRKNINVCETCAIFPEEGFETCCYLC
jgi:signal recognition particle subunit SRP54